MSDYYSKFPFVKEVTGAVTSQAVIRLTKEIFSEQGVPASVYSDNGSQYSSSEYRRFSEQWEFNHTTSSPHFPQSNGFIERQIQTVKRTMQKAGAAKIDMAMAMLILRSTPIDSQLPSPAELLYARKLQANIPTKMSDRRANREDVHERLLQRQLQQKSYHESRGTRSLPELFSDQHVMIRDHVTGSWKPAIVKDVIADEPRSYNVEQPSGGILRRNRRHIRTTGEHHQVDNGNDGGPSEGSDETRRDVPDDNANAERNETPPVRPEKHVTFAPDRTYRTRSGRSVKPPRRLEL